MRLPRQHDGQPGHRGPGDQQVSQSLLLLSNAGGRLAA